jgi:hypothetical protein
MSRVLSELQHPYAKAHEPYDQTHGSYAQAHALHVLLIGRKLLNQKTLLVISWVWPKLYMEWFYGWMNLTKPNAKKDMP